MIDVVFSDSACGSLKAAQRYGKGEYRGGCLSVILRHSDGSEPTREELEAARREAEERERLAWENAAPLDGSPEDVYGFHLALSIGDISGNELDARRRQVLEWLWSVYPEHEGKQAAREVFQMAKDNLEEVYARAAQGESFRIWYSDQPDEICGMYWFMARLSQWKERCKKVYLVKLPEWEMDENGNVVQKSGWGEVAPGDWHRYLPLQREVSPVFRRACATHWRTLQEENAPLRAVLNGQLVSMPETIYDHFIASEIAAEKEEFREVMVIGRVLGKYQLGISDTWVALRIEEMIRSGLLEPVSHEIKKDDPTYYRTLRKRLKG